MPLESATSTPGYHDHPPPPYTLVPCSTGSSAPRASRLFSAQLSGLRDRIQQQQAARSAARDRRDDSMLSLLIPRVEALLESVAAIDPTPSLVEAILVPNDAVDKSWRLTDAEGDENGHFTQLIRVCKLEGNGAHQHAPPETSVTAAQERKTETCARRGDQGHEGKQHGSHAQLWWWSDEEMARRLAALLQPAQETAYSDGQNTDQVVGAGGSRETKISGRWSLFRKDNPRRLAWKDSKPIRCPFDETDPSPAPPSDVIGMVVKAEETTFRRQNEMGIWESRTGWGLVVRVRIRT
ncbi:hypothetical protein E4U42_000834 [Claviceps africana]|uniref:Uncharacterized protein n=1 Tax=Claviceps africana TaxID=83212 RepID=A0A8K0J9M2_9HYPO|nr:hypothetical protein E4U42_000834 [Claviceps africana]